jgi:hypothetical protein
MSELQTAINKQINETSLKTAASYLGKNVDEVLKDLGHAPIDGEQVAGNALNKLKAAVGGNTNVYAGGASLWGFIRGGISANVYFGSAGSYTYSGSMWTSPIGVGGGGAGAWSMTPSNGQAMDFVWAGGAFEGGSCAIFWSINGVVVGAMTVVVAGLGAGGGKGSGTWAKG